MFKKILSPLIWIVISLISFTSIAVIALVRGEHISSVWLILAAVCTQLIGYRFYSAWIATRILMLDENRLTPAVRLNDGKDFMPINRWIVFGHHFAAIAGPGPLIGTTLAMQFGYLPGTLWILIGAVLGGAVQDMTILFASVRRDGKSLGQMIKEEIGPIAGFAALTGTLAIIIILISVLGLIIVKALSSSPWGSFTVFCTIPIAMLVGVYLAFIRPAKVMEASLIGVGLFLLAVYGGKIINENPALGAIFNCSDLFLVFSLIIYGFCAAVLPVWLLLTPRDYLSSFLKIGVILLLAIAIFIYRPVMQMPALTGFINGSGPIFSGKIFPFLFITIACGAISGFHSLVSSGTTPKIINSEKDIRIIGYGAMLLESFVAIMAIIAASVLEPGIYFAINVPGAVFGGDLANTISKINSWGYIIDLKTMQDLAKEMGENSLFGRSGGAPSLAVGMANIFSAVSGNKFLSLWYHFAIMFEAVFILTTLDAGTRVARFMLQDLLANVYKPFKYCNLNKKSAILMTIISSFLIVAAWGYFLYVGTIDPNGGVSIFWPLFGISNQMLAGIAFSAISVILVKSGRGKYALITILPLILILTITSIAAYQKLFLNDPTLSFMALASKLQANLDLGLIVQDKIAATKRIIFNQKLVSIITLIFLTILWIVFIEAMRSIFNYQRNAKYLKNQTN